MKNLLLFLALISLNSITARAQLVPMGPVHANEFNIIYGPAGTLPEHIPTKRKIPYEYVREADAVWSKRMWRYIDLREKINHPLYYPLDEITADGRWVTNSMRWSLWTVIRSNVLQGNLRVFSPYDPITLGVGQWDGDQLKYPVDPVPGGNYETDPIYREEMLYYMGKLGPQSDIPLVDQWGNDSIVEFDDGSLAMVYPSPDTLWYTSDDIIQYRLKEDWFFDKERSVMDVRIIAIAPVVYRTDIDVQGNESISGTMELFWLYFPHCRFVFNNYFVYNEHNDAQWMSFDDLFWKRKFNSVIYKESNSYDRTIDTYRAGADALYESEAITNEVRNIEHDLWSF